MGKTQDINANDALVLLKEAKQQNVSVSIEGKVGSSEIQAREVQFAIGLISSRHPRIDRSRVSGLHSIVVSGEREYHEISLCSDVPYYYLEIRYSLSREYQGGILDFLGVLKDAGKAILHIRDEPEDF